MDDLSDVIPSSKRKCLTEHRSGILLVYPMVSKFLKWADVSTLYGTGHIALRRHLRQCTKEIVTDACDSVHGQMSIAYADRACDCNPVYDNVSNLKFLVNLTHLTYYSVTSHRGGFGEKQDRLPLLKSLSKLTHLVISLRSGHKFTECLPLSLEHLILSVQTMPKKFPLSHLTNLVNVSIKCKHDTYPSSPFDEKHQLPPSLTCLRLAGTALDGAELRSLPRSITCLSVRRLFNFVFSDLPPDLVRLETSESSVLKKSLQTTTSTESPLSNLEYVSVPFERVDIATQDWPFSVTDISIHCPDEYVPYTLPLFNGDQSASRLPANVRTLRIFGTDLTPMSLLNAVHSLRNLVHLHIQGNVDDILVFKNLASVESLRFFVDSGLWKENEAFSISCRNKLSKLDFLPNQCKYLQLDSGASEIAPEFHMDNFVIPDTLIHVCFRHSFDLLRAKLHFIPTGTLLIPSEAASPRIKVTVLFVAIANQRSRQPPEISSHPRLKVSYDAHRVALANGKSLPGNHNVVWDENVSRSESVVSDVTCLFQVTHNATFSTAHADSHIPNAIPPKYYPWGWHEFAHATTRAPKNKSSKVRR